MERVDVLVVEDDPRLLVALAEVFREEGFNVRAFASAEAALPFIRSERPRLVVTDEQLPGMVGHELMRRVRDELGASSPRFVLMTGADRPRSELAGFDATLAKPFRLDDLLANARRLGLRRTRSSVRRRADGASEETG